MQEHCVSITSASATKSQFASISLRSEGCEKGHWFDLFGVTAPERSEPCERSAAAAQPSKPITRVPLPEPLPSQACPRPTPKPKPNPKPNLFLPIPTYT